MLLVVLGLPWAGPDLHAVPPPRLDLGHAVALDGLLLGEDGPTAPESGPLAADPDGLPGFAMVPIPVEAGDAEVLAHYPDNQHLRSPFGPGVTVACEGLMQWLAPRGDGTRWHSGLDLVPAARKARGHLLFSPGDGFVLRVADGHPQWGSYLVAVYRQGRHLYLTGWLHLEPGSHHHLKPKLPRRVAAGEAIARVGSSGAARGAHLHLDVIRLREPEAPEDLSAPLWKGRDWSEFVHPAEVIEDLPRSVYRNRARPSAGRMTITRLREPPTGPG